jgi:hypothetical protein
LAENSDLKKKTVELQKVVDKLKKDNYYLLKTASEEVSVLTDIIEKHVEQSDMKKKQREK